MKHHVSSRIFIQDPIFISSWGSVSDEWASTALMILMGGCSSLDLLSRLDYLVSRAVEHMENNPNLGSDCRIPVRKPPLKRSGSGT